jgi:hypothetical protein
MNLSIKALYGALLSNGVTKATADAIKADLTDFESPGNPRGITAKPNSGGFQNMNEGTINDGGLTEGTPRSANGASADEFCEDSSDTAEQPPPSEAYQQLGASLASAVGATMKGSFDSLEVKLDKMIDILSNASRNVVKPPALGKSVAVEKSATETDIGAITAALNRLRDAGQVSMAESIQASRMLNHYAIAKANPETMDQFRIEVAGCSSSSVRDVFEALVGGRPALRSL